MPEPLWRHAPIIKSRAFSRASVVIAALPVIGLDMVVENGTKRVSEGEQERQITCDGDQFFALAVVLQHGGRSHQQATYIRCRFQNQLYIRIRTPGHARRIYRFMLNPHAPLPAPGIKLCSAFIVMIQVPVLSSSPVVSPGEIESGRVSSDGEQRALVLFPVQAYGVSSYT